MRHKQRDSEIFSLSFLDVICCGFGAIILLLVLSEFGQPLVIERSRNDLELQLKKLQEELFLIRGDSERLERELRGRVDVLTRERLNLARAAGEMSSLRSQYDTSRQEAAVSNIVENELLSAFQNLQAENQRLAQMSQARRRINTQAVGGISVDSDYVILLVDTSPSMYDFHWESAISVTQSILNLYPRLKGFQILDDEGYEMIRSKEPRWLLDSKQLREDIIQRMRRWKPFSDSNPANGIQRAIERYWSADKKISIYVLGDDFAAEEGIQSVLDTIDRINRPGQDGRRRVRIHGVGFPHSTMNTTASMRRFPAFMRALTERNDGTFIGLSDIKICDAPININGVQTCVGGS